MTFIFIALLAATACQRENRAPAELAFVETNRCAEERTHVAAAWSAVCSTADCIPGASIRASIDAVV